MSSDRYRFTQLEIAEAGDISVDTIRSWFHRGHFDIDLSDYAVPPAREGVGISPQTGVAILIALKLAEAGADPKIAANAGMIFGHTCRGGRPIPGVPFRSGHTVVVAKNDGNVEVRNGPPELADAIGGATILEVGKLVNEFAKKLNKIAAR